MTYILWVKNKENKQYNEGYSRKSKEECEKLYKESFTHCDYKIEKASGH